MNAPLSTPLSNSALIDKDQQHMIHPLHHNAGHANARVWVRAEGSHLIDADGKRFIQGNRLGSTNDRWGEDKRLQEFREKGLKKR